MALLQKMESVVGPGIIDKQRIFSIPEADGKPTSKSDSGVLPELGASRYGALFQGGPGTPSDMYRASQIPQPLPNVQLIRSVPLQTDELVQPVYPPLARMAHIECTLSFNFAIDRGPRRSVTPHH
jgi:hypothetical protein